jgi:hypothetical protein
MPEYWHCSIDNRLKWWMIGIDLPIIVTSRRGFGNAEYPLPWH